jgi:hypothetical protein
MRTIPNREDKKFVQSNRSDILGNLWSTFNVDLQSNLGTLKVSPRLRINTAGETNQGRMIAARTFAGRIFAICGSRIFKNTGYNLTDTFLLDSSTGVVTTYTATADLENFNNTLCATTGGTSGKLYSKALDTAGDGEWTERGSFSFFAPAKLCYFQKHNRLYIIIDDDSIHSIDTDWATASTGDYTINLSSTMVGILRTMETDVDNMWIGTFNVNPSFSLRAMKGAQILRWDGITPGSVFKYDINASGVLALAKDNSNIIHAFDTNGALLRFNGGGFEEIGRLPLVKELLRNATAAGLDAFIHPNGMTYTKNGTFKFLINNEVGDTDESIKENLPSGIWEWSQENGFVHVQSVTYNELGSETITDYGQNRVASVGALYEPNLYSEASAGKPTLICGVDFIDKDGETVSGIFVDDPKDTIQKYGYFVTTWIESQQLRDVWQKAFVKVKKFLSDTDKIVLKYRTGEQEPVYVDITWISETQFTTTTNILAKEGQEVEIIQGTGGGKTAHITQIDWDNVVYTVSLDDSFSGADGVGKARIQNWIKASTFSNQSSEDCEFVIGHTSSRIQVKVCMQFTGDNTFRELAIISDVFKPLA